MFEGEGCITTDGGNSYQLRVDNTDEEVVRRFAAIVEAGTVDGPYGQDNACDGHVRKPFWAWVAFEDEAVAVIDMFAPWLTKRRLARSRELGVDPISREIGPRWPE
ncbi:MAG TPA: hypothetical protein VGJ77_03135 [Gaiellaceae bacterium]